MTDGELFRGLLFDERARDGATRSASGNATGGMPEGKLCSAQTDEVDALARLRDRLVRTAASLNLVDLAYRTIDTPIGNLLLVATEAGLLRVAFEAEDHDQVLAQLATKVSPRILRNPTRLDVVARQIDEYFGQQRLEFELALDFQLSQGFRRTVLDRLLHISYGTTASYAEVAAAAGNPKAMRATGTACATNPLPIVVPCHRVLRSDGSLGGYLGGLDAKRLLLQLERISIR